MINITFNSKTLELDINGHAGQDEKGKDIVCSAISTLFYTLGQAIVDSREMLEENPVIKYKDGAGYLCCKPKAEYEGNILRSYWTILEGFQMIATEYKKFVTLVIVG